VQGSAVLAYGCVWLFFSPDSRQGFRRAVSEDRRNWRDGGHTGLLPAQFGCRRIGLPFVHRGADRWTMLFEGLDSKGFGIYAAESADGIVWEPAGDGARLYVPDASSWDAGGQANPSWFRLPDGREGLLYNGHAPGCNGQWEIGLLLPAKAGCWRSAGPPLVRRSGSWAGGRIEGARMLAAPGWPRRLLYFGTTATRDSFAGGSIIGADVYITDEEARA
jgi:hypothetical protein